MQLSNEVILRPRFNFEVNHNNQKLLELFDAQKNNASNIIVTRVEDHVFLKIPKAQQHYWSPQLHLEIMEIDSNSSKLFGVFGPNPTIWTMFMFLHFLVATLFIGFGIWAYTNWSLSQDFTIQVFLMLLMVVCWVVLYLAGRLGKKSGMDEMHQLHHFMRDTLRMLNS